MMKLYLFRILIITTSTYSVHGMYYGLIQEDLEKIEKQEKNEKFGKNSISNIMRHSIRQLISFHYQAPEFKTSKKLFSLSSQTIENLLFDDLLSLIEQYLSHTSNQPLCSNPYGILFDKACHNQFLNAQEQYISSQSNTYQQVKKEHFPNRKECFFNETKNSLKQIQMIFSITYSACPKAMKIIKKIKKKVSWLLDKTNLFNEPKRILYIK